MAKFELFKGKAKDFGKGVMEIGKPVLLGTTGVIVAQKFLDFKTLFPNVTPDKFFIKHEGLIKVGAVIVTLAMWKKCPELLKWLLIGVAIQGGIKAVRTYTMGDAGKAFVESIGAGEYDKDILSLAAAVKNATNEFPTGVGSIADILNPKVDQKLEKSPAVSLNVNSSSGVSGMGLGIEEETEFFSKAA
jgi:hypothetical protein